MFGELHWELIQFIHFVHSVWLRPFKVAVASLLLLYRQSSISFFLPHFDVTVVQSLMIFLFLGRLP